MIKKNLAECYPELTYDELIKVTAGDVKALGDDELLVLKSLLEKDTSELTAQLNEANAPMLDPDNKLRGFGHTRMVAGAERKVRNRILYVVILEISQRTEGTVEYWQHFADSVCQAMTLLLGGEVKKSVLTKAKELRTGVKSTEVVAVAPKERRTYNGPY